MYRPEVSEQVRVTDQAGDMRLPVVTGSEIAPEANVPTQISAPETDSTAGTDDTPGFGKVVTVEDNPARLF